VEQSLLIVTLKKEWEEMRLKAWALERIFA